MTKEYKEKKTKTNRETNKKQNKTKLETAQTSTAKQKTKKVVPCTCLVFIAAGAYWDFQHKSGWESSN